MGIIDGRYAPGGLEPQASGAVIYWHVDDIEAAREKLLSHGGKEYEPVIERGKGFVTASVVDPFRNILGIMYNQHYLDILNEK